MVAKRRAGVRTPADPVVSSITSSSLHNILERLAAATAEQSQERYGNRIRGLELCFDNGMMKTNFVSNGKIDQRSDDTGAQWLKIACKKPQIFITFE